MKLKSKVLRNPESHFRGAKEPHVANPLGVLVNLKHSHALYFKKSYLFGFRHDTLVSTSIPRVRPENMKSKHYMQNGLSINQTNNDLSNY